jgi:hypothetical protein
LPRLASQNDPEFAKLFKMSREELEESSSGSGSYSENDEIENERNRSPVDLLEPEVNPHTSTQSSWAHEQSTDLPSTSQKDQRGRESPKPARSEVPNPRKHRHSTPKHVSHSKHREEQKQEKHRKETSHKRSRSQSTQERVPSAKKPKPSRRHSATSTKGSSYSQSELKCMLLSMWNSLPAKEAWKEFNQEFKFTTRTKGSFTQKYQTMLREMHIRTGQQGYQNQVEKPEDLTAKSPELAFEFLSPMFISVGSKHYLVHSKKHFKSIQSGSNGKGTNTLIHSGQNLRV